MKRPTDEFFTCQTCNKNDISMQILPQNDQSVIKNLKRSQMIDSQSKNLQILHKQGSEFRKNESRMNYFHSKIMTHNL